MVHEYVINGVPIRTGDVICTTDGDDSIAAGQFWRLVGKLIYGDVDHCVIYVGPKGRCVEAGPKGVIEFEVKDGQWNNKGMMQERCFHDTFYGVAYPLENSDVAEEKKPEVRAAVAEYCITQARAGKPYNLNFPDSDTENAFYCSQLAYAAYRKHGVNLNTNEGVPDIPFTESIIFPQEIWSGCANSKP